MSVFSDEHAEALNDIAEEFGEAVVLHLAGGALDVPVPDAILRSFKNDQQMDERGEASIYRWELHVRAEELPGGDPDAVVAVMARGRDWEVVKTDLSSIPGQYLFEIKLKPFTERAISGFRGR